MSSQDVTPNVFDSNDPSTELDYKIAARLVKDARDVRNIRFRQTRRDIDFYELYLNGWFIGITYVVIFVHLVILPFIEPPVYVKNVPFWLPIGIEFFCLFVYLIRWIHLKWFQTNSDFFSDKKHIVVLVIIIVTTIDLIVFAATNKFRVTRSLRVLFYINFNEGKELRRAFRNVRKTLADIFSVYFLFMTSLLVFSFIAYRLFRTKGLFYPNGEAYFSTYEDALWDLYVAVTTANFPDVMMPAYDSSVFYALFFIIFLLLNLYLFINIILATIYSNYKKHLKNEVKETILLKRENLKTAYEIIYSSGKTSRSGGIKLPEFEKLIKLVDSKKSDHQICVLFKILDDNNDEMLCLNEFLYLSDLLNVRISEIKDRQTLIQKYFPNFYNNSASILLQKVVRHKYFSIPVDVLITLNFLLLIFDLNQAEWFFLSAFIVEILLKLYVFGAIEFFARYWNIFDSVIIGAGLIIGIVEATSEAISREFLEVILILRLLRLLKLFAEIKRFRIVITTIMNITPSLVTYATLILTVYYIFAMIGMEIYSDKIKSDTHDLYCGNSKLNNTEFAKLKYCRNNFQDFLKAIVLMFELMVVNQWHVLSGGFVKVTSKWSRFFFFAFHSSCVIVCLNIFTAFVIEAFLLEYEADEKSNFEIKIEKKIKELGYGLDENENDMANNTEGVKFHMNSKGPKSVEALLQRMFSSEFDITQDNISVNNEVN